MRKIILFVILFIALSSSCYAATTHIKFNTVPGDNISQAETLKITGKVSAPLDIGCRVVVVIKHKTSESWIEIKTLVNETLNPSTNKTYNLEWRIPQDAEPGKYGVYAKTIVNNKRDAWSYPKFNVVKATTPQQNCEPGFVGSQYCEKGALYQDYKQSNCSIIKKKIKLCTFGCKNERECNSENVSKENISYSKDLNKSNISKIQNSNTTNNNATPISNITKNTSKFSETQENANKINFSHTQTIKQKDFSAMFSKSSNLSLIGIIVILVIIGIILLKL